MNSSSAGMPETDLGLQKQRLQEKITAPVGEMLGTEELPIFCY